MAMFAHAAYMNWQVDSMDTAGFEGANQFVLYHNGSAVDRATGSQPNTISLADIGQDSTFYVELVNFESQNVLARSDTATYSDIAGSLFTDELSAVNSVQAWHGSNYKAVPEPTSGFLMMVGLALLGLKRRKV